MGNTAEQARINVGPQGRIVIPARLRRSLAIEQGDTLVASLEEGRIVLEKREKVLARVRRRFEKVPREVSLADELISERREEARREQAGE
jgi:AbrB family looped-hinge helix DNA binding protein